MRIRRRPSALLASISTGLGWAVAAEPIGIAPLAWVALVPLFWAVLREHRWRWSLAYGFVAASVFFGFHLAWIFLFGWMAWSALTVVMALYVAVAALGAGIVRRWPMAPVLVAGAWAGMDLVRDRWPYGGFSWGSLGTTQASLPGVRWLAGTVGVYGLSFLVAFGAALIADRIVVGRFAWGSLALVASVLGLFVAVDVVRYAPSDDGEMLRVAVVQGNVPRPARFDQRDRILENHVRLTRGIEEPVDVVVWAEDAIGIGVSPGGHDVPAALARELGVPIIVGRSTADPETQEFVNDVDHVDPDRGVVATYRKRHPVPFGEYVPIGFLRGFVTTLEQVPYDLVRGSEVEVFDVGGNRIGVPICFESVFGRDVRAFARAGAELVVVSTNNASFERSWASVQHLQHAQMRALELRQWVVQAALSGISGVAAPDGTLSERTELFEEAVFVTQVRARPAGSLYARTGDLFPALWAFGTLATIVVYASMVLWGRRRDAVHAGPVETPARVQ